MLHAPQWVKHCLAVGPCVYDLEWDHPADGASVPFLGNTGICVQVAPTAEAGGWNPWVPIQRLYEKTERPFGKEPDTIWGPYQTDDFMGWYIPEQTNRVPFGFVGMDLCWAARIGSSLDPRGMLASGRWQINQGEDIFADPSLKQGVQGLPAMVCNPTWLGWPVVRPCRSRRAAGPRAR
jgi:hypothetical protein